MTSPRNRADAMFTATEAAVLTRLPLKAVNNAIDRKIVPAVPGRLLDMRGLMSLALERCLADRVSPELRRAAHIAAAAAPRNRITLAGGLLSIDLSEPRRELTDALRRLRRARAMVVSDPDILGGSPVFRGTRVPVHQIAALNEQDSSLEDLLAAYPRLTAEMIGLAPVYAAAYPKRGRPRARPWKAGASVRITRRKLATITPG